MSKEQQRAIDAQITELLHKAAEQPGPNDPMGMVAFGSVWLAAKLITIREQGKLFECTRPGGCTRSDCVDKCAD